MAASGLGTLFLTISDIGECESQVVEASSVWGATHYDNDDYVPAVSADNAYALLEEAYTRRYNKSPHVEESKVAEQIFEARVKIGGYEWGVARAANKKAAKHAAAYNVLHEIVSDNEYRQFGLPGTTQAEARDYIDKLDRRVMSNAPTFNYVGKCAELCARKGITRQPEYDFTSVGSSHAATFTCTAHLREHTSESCTGRSKSEAKNAAAAAILDYLQTLPDIEKPSKNRLSPDELKVKRLLDDLCDRVSNLSTELDVPDEDQ